MIDDDKLYKWFHGTMSVLLAVMAVLKAMLVCANHQWGYIPCAIIAIAAFAFLYGLFRLCMYLAKIITYAFMRAYKDKVVPRIEVDAINRYIQEHGIIEETPQSIEQLTELNEAKNTLQRMDQYMKIIKKERKAHLAKKEKENAEKLEKILQYVRSTLIPFEFTDEEILQISECVRSLVVYQIVVPTVPIKIEKTGKKAQLTQLDLGNFAWNIAHQYGLSNPLAADFLRFTFRDWYKSSESSTIAKNLKNTKGRHYNIVINENILEEKPGA